MKILGTVRGFFRQMNVNVKTDSYIKIKGLSVPTQGALVADTGVSKAEKTAILQCFNETNHVYAFGHDPEASQYNVTYLVFLQNSSSCSTADRFSANDAVKKFLQEYNKLKVSKKHATVDLTMGAETYVSGILVSFNVKVYSAELNMLSVTFGFIDLGGPDT